MVPVSVVIIAKNEAHIIARNIDMARKITNDIVVIDNGSTDDTVKIARAAGCRVYQKNWDGYAANKNKGIQLAANDWILSLDADEVADEELVNTLHQLALNDADAVYDIKFRSYFANRRIAFGKWGRDHHVRLFNRTRVKWIGSPVHEVLDIPAGATRICIKGPIHHYSVIGAEDLKSKADMYAHLSARKYFIDGKRANFVKLYLSPLFGFVKNYILCLGFLDGRAGWEIAKVTLKQTHLKYRLLQKLTSQHTTPLPNALYVEDAVLLNY